MKLKNLTARGRPVSSYRSIIKDDKGNAHHELVISGGPDLIKKVFAKSDFDIQISPDETEKGSNRRMQEVWNKFENSAKKPTPAEGLESFKKRTAGPPSPKIQSSLR